MIDIFAAAGIAEAGLAMEAALIFYTLLIIGVIAVVALARWSRVLSGIAMILLLIATLLLEPWYCFSPFEQAAYADPDVQYAAGMFRNAGIIWVATCIATVFSLLLTRLFPKQSQTLYTPDGGQGTARLQP